MPPKCASISRVEAMLAMCVGTVGCGPSDGDVGTLPPGAVSLAPTFEAQFADPTLPWPTLEPPGASVEIGTAAPAASDGHVARLVFPGHPEYSAKSRAGATYRTELSSDERFGYGIHRSRVSFGSCSTTEQVAQAVLGHFSDGSDHNDNGMTDEIEIDFQMLCGQTSLAYLTVFTDYESEARFRKLSHVVDFATGRYYDTPFDDRDDFTQSGTDDRLAIPGLFRSDQFYELGFEWHAGSIRFFLDPGDGERTLWTLADRDHVPTEPVEMVYNLWHPDSYWFPRDGEAQYPDADVSMLVDWYRYYAQ